MYAVISNNKFTGLQYNEMTEAIVHHHTQYGEYLCCPKRAVEEGEDATEADKLNALWLYATHYVTIVCEFDAMGLAAVIGNRVQAELNGKPHSKVDAVLAWNQAIWADHEARRADVKATGSVNLDYSNNGPRPFRVAEVLAEA